LHYSQPYKKSFNCAGKNDCLEIIKIPKNTCTCVDMPLMLSSLHFVVCVAAL